MSKNKLAILMFGEQNSGKSSAWYALFGDKVRTGKHERELILGEFSTNNGNLFDGNVTVPVFLINGSPEESGVTAEDKLSNADPMIVLCSTQYHESATDTLDYFYDNGFEIKVIWINPGANLSASYPYADYLGLANYVLHKCEGEITVKPGGAGPKDSRSIAIAQTVKEKVLGWAAYNL